MHQKCNATQLKKYCTVIVIRSSVLQKYSLNYIKTGQEMWRIWLDCWFLFISTVPHTTTVRIDHKLQRGEWAAGERSGSRVTACYRVSPGIYKRHTPNTVKKELKLTGKKNAFQAILTGFLDCSTMRTFSKDTCNYRDCSIWPALDMAKAIQHLSSRSQ